MSRFQSMVLRVARSVTATLSPSERKKMVMDIFKRFKTMGDGNIRGGKHHIMLATEGYATVVLEDVDDAELNRIFTKYDVANWLKKFGKTATGRVADASTVRWMQKASANLGKASGRLHDAEAYMGGTVDLLVEALGFLKSANADLSDADTEDLVREINSLIRHVDAGSRGIVSQLRELRGKVNDARDQYGDEIAWELQHPSD